MMKRTNKTMVMVGWTTVSSKENAVKIIEDLVQMNLIACGQVSGPIESHYKWDDRVIKDTEWRVTLKYSQNKGPELIQEIMKIHPYENPQWVSIKAESTEAYLNWVNQ